MTAAGLPDGPTLSIGAVLSRLKGEFSDVSISKIRFLESEGLVTPQRTPAGYRQFTEADVARLRYVLGAQRDQYLPLRVIKEHLDAIDRGLEPGVPSPRLPRSLSIATGPSPDDLTGTPSAVRMSRVELLAESGLTSQQLRELEGFGLLAPGPGGWYDADAAVLANTVAELVQRRPRAPPPAPISHRRRPGSVVGRPIGVGPGQQKDPDARERADATAAQLAAVMLRLHSLLVKTGLRRELGR